MAVSTNNMALATREPEILWDNNQAELWDQKLPIEVLDIIFTYLTPCEIARCAEVCREWKVTSDHHPIWRKIAQKLRIPRSIPSIENWKLDRAHVSHIMNHFKKSDCSTRSYNSIIYSDNFWDHSRLCESRALHSLINHAMEHLLSEDNPSIPFFETVLSQPHFNFCAPKIWEAFAIGLADDKLPEETTNRFLEIRHNQTLYDYCHKVTLHNNEIPVLIPKIIMKLSQISEINHLTFFQLFRMLVSLKKGSYEKEFDLIHAEIFKCVKENKISSELEYQLEIIGLLKIKDEVLLLLKELLNQHPDDIATLEHRLWEGRNNETLQDRLDKLRRDIYPRKLDIRDKKLILLLLDCAEKNNIPLKYLSNPYNIIQLIREGIINFKHLIELEKNNEPSKLITEISIIELYNSLFDPENHVTEIDLDEISSRFPDFFYELKNLIESNSNKLDLILNIFPEGHLTIEKLLKDIFENNIDNRTHPIVSSEMVLKAVDLYGRGRLSEKNFLAICNACQERDLVLQNIDAVCDHFSRKTLVSKMFPHLHGKSLNHLNEY